MGSLPTLIPVAAAASPPDAAGAHAGLPSWAPGPPLVRSRGLAREPPHDVGGDPARIARVAGLPRIRGVLADPPDPCHLLVRACDDAGRMAGDPGAVARVPRHRRPRIPGACHSYGLRPWFDPCNGRYRGDNVLHDHARGVRACQAKAPPSGRRTPRILLRLFLLSLSALASYVVTTLLEPAMRI